MCEFQSSSDRKIAAFFYPLKHYFTAEEICVTYRRIHNCMNFFKVTYSICYNQKVMLKKLKMRIQRDGQESRVGLNDPCR
jgi:hypothetical protein